MVIYKAKGLLAHMLTHGVTDKCYKYRAFLYGHLSDEGWLSVIITRKCNSGLKVYGHLPFFSGKSIGVKIEGNKVTKY